jgi:ABC-2 type transport system permease protein
MNYQAIRAIYVFEMSRTARTLLQSIVSPVISTPLYFVVFGAAIGTRIAEIDGISYGAFIVPGLIMLSLLTQSVSNASFGIFFPKFTGTIYELLSAPISYFEIVISYVGAAATGVPGAGRENFSVVYCSTLNICAKRSEVSDLMFTALRCVMP